MTTLRSKYCGWLNDHEGAERDPYTTVCTPETLAEDGMLCDCWCHEPRPGHRHRWRLSSSSFGYELAAHTIEESCICGAYRTRKLVAKPRYKTVKLYPSPRRRKETTADA